MYRFLLERILSSEKQVVGVLYLLDNNDSVVYSCNTLELSYKDNKNNISCIPTGNYKLRQRQSTKYKDHIHVLSVPNREYILIHNANFYKQLRGCIAVGEDLVDINGDDEFDVTNSVKTLNKIVSLYKEYADGEELDLEIVEAY